MTKIKEAGKVPKAHAAKKQEVVPPAEELAQKVLAAPKAKKKK